MLWFSAVYPFLMPWLLWGGSVWTPLGCFAGFVIGYCLPYRRRLRRGASLGLIAAGAGRDLVWWLWSRAGFRWG